MSTSPDGAASTGRAGSASTSTTSQLVGILGMVTFAFLAAPAGMRGPLLAFALIAGPLVFFANLALMGLRMVVSDGGVDVFVGIRRSHYPFDQIAAVEAESYRFKDFPFGRGNTKWGPKGRAFVGGLFPGEQPGVALTLTNGKRVVITTNDPVGMQKAIEEGLANSRASGLRIEPAAHPDAAALAAAEAEASEELTEEREAR